MTTAVDIERELQAWLTDAGPVAIRTGLVEDSLVRARSVRQRHTSLPIVGAEPWPRPPLDSLGPVSLLVAMVALAVAGMALLLAGGRYDRAVLPTGPSVTMPASVLPSPTATTRGSSGPSARIPLELEGTWIAVPPTRASFDGPAAHHMRLTIAPDGVQFELQGIDDGGVLRWSPWVDETTSELRLIADGPSVPFRSLRIDGSARGGCSTGATGIYSWRISDDPDGPGDRLQLDLIHDQCSILQALIPGTWVREEPQESPPPGP